MVTMNKGKIRKLTWWFKASLDKTQVWRLANKVGEVFDKYDKWPFQAAKDKGMKL